MEDETTLECLPSGEPDAGPTSDAGALHFEDIGGYAEVIEAVREIVELPLKHPRIYGRLGLDPPRGILLYGPPGTGKTLLAKILATECGAEFIRIDGPEIVAKFYGESEGNLRHKFEEARRRAPSILFIDEIDSIAPKRDDSPGEVERRIVAQLLASMDGVQSRGEVVVIGATNRIDALDGALRRGGRFDKEIEVGVPSERERLEILGIHTRRTPLSTDVDLKAVAGRIHGYVGADIANLCREAGLCAIREFFPDWKELGEVSDEFLNGLFVCERHFRQAEACQEPSVLRDVRVEVPAVEWGDIGGNAEAVRVLREEVEWPLRYPDLYDYYKERPSKGILIYGPSGTGKTTMAKAVATEAGVNFIGVKGTEFLSKWVGESEKAVRELFKKARQTSPSIIFIDEIDTVGSVRFSDRGDSGVAARVLSQILSEMDGLVELKDVVVIGATNRPDLIDPSLVRSGRFDRLIRLFPPDKEARKQIFLVHTRHKPLADGVDMDLLSERAEGLTGADIAVICREASKSAMRRCIDGRTGRPGPCFPRIAMEDMMSAVDSVLSAGGRSGCRAE